PRGSRTARGVRAAGGSGAAGGHQPDVLDVLQRLQLAAGGHGEGPAVLGDVAARRHHAAGLQRGGEVGGGQPGVGQFVLVGGDGDLGVHHTGQQRGAHPVDRLQLRDDLFAQRFGERLGVAVTGAGGEHHHRHVVHAERLHGGVDVVGQRGLRLVDRLLHVAHHVVGAVTVVELGDHLGAAGGGGR